MTIYFGYHSPDKSQQETGRTQDGPLQMPVGWVGKCLKKDSGTNEVFESQYIFGPTLSCLDLWMLIFKVGFKS